MRTLRDVQDLLPTSLDTGLPPDEVERSRRAFGGNRLTPLPRQPLWHKFLEKFDEPIIKILLAAALLSLVVDLFKTDAALGLQACGVVGAVVLGALTLRQGHWLPALLFALALVLFVVGVGRGQVLVEGLAVLVAVVLATGVAFANEFKSDREFDLLNAHKTDLRAKVIRGEAVRTVPLEEVVVGDLVVLEAGDEVPADGRLVRATALDVDQSLMTGESGPAHKQPRPADDTAEGPEQPGCLYRGTMIVDGLGQMLVTEVGDATCLGQIARQLSAVPGEETRVRHKLTLSRERTPLQLKLTRLAALISRVGYVAATLIFLAQLLHGLLAGKVHWPQTGRAALDVFGVLLGYVVTLVIVIVVAVPEGLPMSVTVSLALAMRKMTRAHALVRQLAACETIGSATVICVDKTGTLTQNRMRVDRLGWGEGQVLDRGGPGWTTIGPEVSWPADGKPLAWMALNAAVNATANLEEKAGQLVTVGSSTEGALLHYLREGGLDYTRVRMQLVPLYQVHFTSDRKRMVTVIAHAGRLVTLVKGAPEGLLEQSSHYLDADGTARPWTEAARAAVQARLHESALLAMRTLAFGHAVLAEDMPPDAGGLHGRREALESGLLFAGFVGIRDPVRDDVREAVDRCQRAGIAVKMISGDSVHTARAVGHAIGLIDRADAAIDTPDAAVLTSARFQQMSDDDVKKALPTLRILARAQPLDKLRLVQLLQEQNEVVAVTGDGTNDAPALKQADVGLAMGIAGTAVAREASKIVLLDDAFTTIVRAVHWGRSLYENIQRFLQFQLTINVSALAIFFLGTLFFQVETPFTVLQLLWINVIMDTLASLALCSGPPRPGLMRRPPKKRDENILTPGMVRTILLTAAFFVGTMLTLLVLMKGDPDHPGLFAGAGPWSAEAAGTRAAVARSDLEQDGRGHWFVKQATTNAHGQPVLERVPAEVSFTVRQVSLFFSVYVFFQVWNQLNCRSLTPEVSGLHGLASNPTFLFIAAVVAVGQVLIVTFGSPVFSVEPLSAVQWLAVIAATSSVLLFAEGARRLQLGRGRRGPAR